ncbi:MAG: nuclear transport factor 2 family protein [Chakrabartia sp.]
MEAAVHAYVAAFAKGDPEMAAGIFADDAIVEDPIGSEPRVGKEAIRAFYVQSMATGATLHLTGPIRIAAAHAAFAMQVRLHWDGKDMAIDVIDTFAFNTDGKVARMQAYFGPGNMHG